MANDYNKPTTASNITETFTELRDNINDSARMFDGVSPITNPKDKFKQFHADGYLLSYNESWATWDDEVWSKLVFDSTTGLALLDEDANGVTLTTESLTDIQVLNFTASARFIFGGNEVITALSSGVVGINKATPEYAVDVVGDVNFTGNIYRDGVLIGGDLNVWTQNGSDIFFTGGNVGIGTSSPEAPLHVDSSTGNLGAKFSSLDENIYIAFEDDGTTIPPLIGGRDNNLLFWTGNTERVRIDNSGNVGIGTSSPSAKLGVDNPTNNTSSFRISKSGNARHNFYIDSSGNSGSGFYDNSNTLKALINTAGNSFFNGGNVGVGTSSPDADAKMHVSGSTTQKIRLSNTNDSVDLDLIASDFGSGSASLQTFSNHPLKLGTNNSTAVTIDTNQNVGIGTAEPSSKLHVAGEETLVGTAGTDQALYLADNKWTTSNGDSVGIMFGKSWGNNRIGPVITAVANATSSVNARRDIVFKQHSALDYTTLYEAMRLTADGGLGIGTNSPSTTLDVNGPIKCASYTVATVPSASSSGAGAQIYVTDETGGAVPCFSDGTNWRRVTDRAIIS